MAITNFRASEALYIVIVRDKDAEQRLRQWAKTSNAQVQIESNKMKIFEARTLNLFQVGWKHSWENVIIWDAWNRRHLEIV